MFKKLADFSHVRSRKEALGFFIAYLFLGMLIGGLAGGLYGLITGVKGAEGFEAGVKAGHIASIFYVAILGLAMLAGKKLFTHFGWWLLVVAAVLATLFLGSIVGLIPLAFLTTKPNRTVASGVERDPW